jgi:hypothetical protein
MIKRDTKLPIDIISFNWQTYPLYSISPFNIEYIKINHRIYLQNQKRNIKDDSLNKYFNDEKNFSYITKRGREGISMILTHLKLKKQDEIYILNTSGSSYISSSVTSEIDKICKWSRKINRNTKSIFIIHEFGFPAKIPKNIFKLRLPIIEDCAYCLGSQNENNTLGKLGDFTIYSFPKIFPIPYGGLIRSKEKLCTCSSITDYSKNYLLILLHFYFKKLNLYSKLRKKNYTILTNLFTKHGILPRFKLNKNNTPACFVFSLPQNNLSKNLKVMLNNKGIESTLYYGGNGFYVPSHQNLKVTDIEYIYRNICKYLNLKSNEK